MKSKTLLFLSLFAALAANSFAQNFHSDGPRSASTKQSGVKASVFVNTVALEQTAVELLNQTRIQKGLQSLVWNEKLALIARLHSQNMAAFNFFGHRGLDDKMVSHRADEAGLGRWRAIGENIAYNRGYADPISRAVELWLDSPPHRRNLLNNNWKETAIGIAVAPDGSYYLTQVFMKR